MVILSASPFLIALSALLDLLSELGVVQVYGAIYSFMRIIFILVLFLGARSIVMGWKKLS